MAADLYVHILTDDVSEDDMNIFFASSFGHERFDMKRAAVAQGDGSWHAAYDRISKTPQYHIGEVSWLKAALFGDSESFIPPPVQAVAAAIGDDLPILDDPLIDSLIGAMTRGNPTAYATDKELGEFRAFLEEHRGKRVFTVSW
jgi:hypothetical protein